MQMAGFGLVGALDAIADIVGTAAGVHWLRTARRTAAPVEETAEHAEPNR